MHVLYLTTELPFPAVSGGRVRTAADLTLLESLPEVRSVDLLCLEEEPSPPEALREVAEKLPKARLLGPIFHPIHLKKFPHYLPLVAALRVVPGYPYLAGKWARGISGSRRHDSMGGQPRWFRCLNRTAGPVLIARGCR